MAATVLSGSKCKNPADAGLGAQGSDRPTGALPASTAAWQSLGFKFTAGADLSDATVHISGTATSLIQSQKISFEAIRARGNGAVWQLMGKSPEAANQVGQPPQDTGQESQIPALSRGLTFPAVSVSIYEFAISGTR